VTEETTTTAAASPRRGRPILGRLILLSLLVGLAALTWFEARNSRLQARLLSGYGRKLTWRMAAGSSDSIAFPSTGPFDIRRGYALLPAVTDSLMEQGFSITEQARFSPEMLQVARLGLYPPYPAKSRAGLSILDQDGHAFYSAVYPARVYTDFDSIPPLVVRTLLFIENRELLDDRYPYRNPAVEWDPLARASFDLLLHAVIPGHNIPGGSTLATQIEKFRHSDEGRTSAPQDKLRQMASASLKAYLGGENTLAERRRIVLDFINSVPLAALPGYGEVSGLGDGLWAWYGADFAADNARLRFDPQSDDPAGLAERALAYRRVLSLFIAHRRPSVYLLSGREILKTDTDAYIRLMEKAGLISPTLGAAALGAHPTFRSTPPVVAHASFVARKAANAMRARLLNYTGIEQFYDLDRLDLTASTTLDRRAQEGVTRTLQRLKDPAFTDSCGLRRPPPPAGGRPRRRHLQLHAVRARGRPQPAARAGRQLRPAVRYQRGGQARPGLHGQAAHAGDLPGDLRRAAS
jgi:membrane peptidoglycan carboxypeptidase